MMVEALPPSAVKTFTIGFDQRSFDESSHGRRVAAHSGQTTTKRCSRPG